MAVSKIDGLLQSFERHLGFPWRPDLSPDERVWFLVYPPELERKVRAKLGEFELCVSKSGRKWFPLDFTQSLPVWVSQHPYAEAFYQSPEDLDDGALTEFADNLVEGAMNDMEQAGVDENTVVAVYGVAALFPQLRVSKLVPRLAKQINGRLVVFFPGEFENNNYRLLGARDGWNYLATPITPGSEG